MTQSAALAILLCESSALISMLLVERFGSVAHIAFVSCNCNRRLSTAAAALDPERVNACVPAPQLQVPACDNMLTGEEMRRPIKCSDPLYHDVTTSQAVLLIWY